MYQGDYMELSILNFIQSLRNPLFDLFFEVLTTLGNRGEIFFALIFLVMLKRKNWKFGKYTLFSLIITVACVELLLKPIVQRPRPFIASPTVQLIIDQPSGFSFPSGHAASAFVVATMFYLNNMPYKKTILVCAFLMAFSRLYVYVHYPSDVIAGSLLGVSIAIAVNKLMINSKIKQSKFEKM